MAERDFQTELIRGARHLACCHVVPIPDGGKMQRFAEPKVYDLGLVDPHGGYHALELKQVSGAGWGWPIRALAEHQEHNLQEAHHHGAAAWVVVNYRLRLSKRRAAALGAPTMNRTWAAPVHQVCTARDHDCLTTLDPDWMAENGVELPLLDGLRDGRGGRLLAWDPRPLWGDAAERRVGRVRDSGRALPRIRDTGKALPRVDPDQVAEALGAERIPPGEVPGQLLLAFGRPGR